MSLGGEVGVGNKRAHAVLNWLQEDCLSGSAKSSDTDRDASSDDGHDYIRPLRWVWLTANVADCGWS